MHGLLESERAAVKQPFLMIDSSSRRVFSQQSCESTPTCILMLHKSSQVPRNTTHSAPLLRFADIWGEAFVRSRIHGGLFSASSLPNTIIPEFLSTFQQPLFQMNDSVARSWKRAANFWGTCMRHMVMMPKCGWIIEKDVDLGVKSDVYKC